MADEKLYMVARAHGNRLPEHGGYMQYEVCTVVAAKDATDAVNQVAYAQGNIGGFVAWEVDAVAVSITPQRIQLGDGNDR